MRACFHRLLLPLLALLLLAEGAPAQTCEERVCVPVGETEGQEFLCEGDVLATDAVAGVVARVHRPCDDPPTSSLVLFVTGGSPEGITTDSRGFIYWSDASNKEILRFEPEISGEALLNVVAPEPGTAPFNVVEDLEFSPDFEKLLVADPLTVPGAFVPATIWEVDPISGVLGVAVEESDQTGRFRPESPEGIAFDPDDPSILYIADGTFPHGGVYRVDLDDGLSDPVPITDTDTRTLLDGPGGTPQAGLIQIPYDVEVYDPDPATPGDHLLLVSNQPFPDCCGFDPPSDAKVFVVTEPASTVYDEETGLVGGGVAYQLIGASALDHPLGIALADEAVDDGVADRLYVADLTAGEIQRFPISGSGTSVTTGPSPTPFPGFLAPWGLHVVDEIQLEERQPFVVVDRTFSTSASELIRLTPDPTDLDDADGDGEITANIATATPTTLVVGEDLIEPVGICVDEMGDGTPFYTATTLQSLASPDLVEIVEAMDPDPASAIAFDLPPGALKDPSRILLDSAGDYLVLDRDVDLGISRIVRVPADGSPPEDYISSDDEPLIDQIVAFAIDADGVMVLANATDDPEASVEPLLRVLPELPDLVDGERVFPLEFADVEWSDVRDMTIDRNGDALVLDRNNFVFGPGPGIVRVSSVNGDFRLKSYTSLLIDNVNGIALDANREILVTEEGAPNDPSFPSRVLRFDPVNGNGFALFDYAEEAANETDPPTTVDLEFTRLNGIALDERRPAPALADDDRDGFGASYDNCEPTGDDLPFCRGTAPFPCHNPDQSDVNGNGIGDICERNDPDQDGWREIPDCDPAKRDCGADEDNCPIWSDSANGFCPNSVNVCSDCTDAASCSNPDQSDVNQDGIGDACQPFDADDDGVPEQDPDDPDAEVCTNGNRVGCIDNCSIANPSQDDFDDDGIGDACEDSDGDGLNDDVDNCPDVSNPDQLNLDLEFESVPVGDACDDDDDNDGFPEEGVEPLDNCDPNTDLAFCRNLEGATCANPSQSDVNGNGTGDICEPNDSDEDGVPEVIAGDTGPCTAGVITSLCLDNCPIPNPDQADEDEDGIGDVCDDSDGDGVVDDEDNCRTTFNPPPADGEPQPDANGDGIGDACQPDDADGDGIPEDLQFNIGPCTGGDITTNCLDNCAPPVANSDQADLDADGVGDLCDDDEDGDGVSDASDNCPVDVNADQTDSDGDGFGNRCDMDLTGDNRVALPDFSAFSTLFGTTPSTPEEEQADSDGDGLIGLPDFSVFIDRYGRCAGDAELPDSSCTPTAP